MFPALSIFEIFFPTRVGYDPFIVQTRGGQTAALRTFVCGSLSFPKNYIFIFLFLLQSVKIL